MTPDPAEELLSSWQVRETFEEATGRSVRPDPVAARTGGAAGNARLTAWTGALLLVLLAAEGITLLDVRGLIGWHVAIGTLLIPPALLKTATTGWRVVRYYRGAAAYRLAGPPPMPLRVLGPLVVVSTLAVLGTGVLVVLLGPERGRGSLWGTPISALFLHQASFAVWIAVTTLHVLGRLVPALNIITGRVTTSTVAGRIARTAALLVVAGLAIWLAIVLYAAVPGWQHDLPFQDLHDGG
ncbi:MAG: hypothetical protein ABI131_00310 [Nostocoides sp.]